MGLDVEVSPRLHGIVALDLLGGACTLSEECAGRLVDH